MNIENFISDAVRRSVEALYGTLDGEQLQIQKTRNCLLYTSPSPRDCS